MLRALAVFASATIAIGCANEVGWLSSRSTLAPRAPRADLTVMTFNVNFGLAGDAETLDAMASPRADIVLVQESNEAWESAIRQRFSSTYAHMQFGHPERMPAGGLAVLSRFPFEVTDVSPSDGGFFFAWRVVVRTPSGPVQFLNVHLRPQVSDSGSFIVGRFTTGANREREIRAHLQRLSADMPTIVAGDFNEDEGGRAVRTLAARGMLSALQEFAPRDTTWRWTIGSITVRQRFDHIVYDPARFECVHARATHEGRSDHVPVVARLRFR